MARNLFSPSWHSVASLRPRLIAHANVQRCMFRGKPWYVVQDQTGGRMFRMTPAAYAFVAGMNGKRTVQALWEQANASEARDACTQPEIVDLLAQLHATDLLQSDVTPDSSASLERHKAKRVERFKQWLLNPMSLKFPLVNPDRFLTRCAPAFAWCFGRLGAIFWLAVVLPALVLAAQHWSELTHNLSDRVLSASNLLVMLAVYPAVKLLHELGHGLGTKRWGGAAPEMGLMFLVFAPVPYIEASSTAAFPSKYRRAIVAAAGMLIELFLASLALYVWLLVQPGVVRAVAFNVMVISGISTLIINGNPLLRYDGYFILSDLIEMPNLAQRGTAYWTWLLDHYVFGAEDASAPDESPSERRWLLVYSPLAWLYRTMVTVSIIMLVADKFFFVGIVIALWATFSLVGMPLYKGWKHLYTSPALHRRRPQAMRTTVIAIVVLLAVLLWIPLPLRTRAEGVVWLPERAILRAHESGFFDHWLVKPGTRVKPGQAVFVLNNPEIAAEVRMAAAQVAATQARYDALHFADPAKGQSEARQLKAAKQQLRLAQERKSRLVGYAQSTGPLVAPSPEDMPGHFYQQGERVGYVLNDNQLLVRVVVPQDNIDLVHQHLDGVDIRLSGAIGNTLPTHIVRRFPAAVHTLPTAALGLSMGGVIPTSPSDPKAQQTLQGVFILDLALPSDNAAKFGERVYVRFDHGTESLVRQWSRRLHQLLLKHFHA